MSWPSGHLGPLEPPGNVQGSTNTSGMTLWNAGTHSGMLACWHSRQDPWHRQTNGDTLLSHSGDSDGTQMMWLVYRMVDDGVYGDEANVISEPEQAENQSTLRKLAQPHKPKINPNFEIWTTLDNLDNFVSFYDRAFS